MLAVLLAILASAYLTLQNSWVQTQITRKIAKRLSNQLDAEITVGRVDVGFFNKLHLEDVLIKDQYNDTLLYTEKATAAIDTLRFKKQILSIKELNFIRNEINIVRDSVESFNFSFLIKSLNSSKKDSTLNWSVKCDKFSFGDLQITYTDKYSENNETFYVHDLNLGISSFESTKDSLAFKLTKLSMNDGEQLMLKNMNADVAISKHTIDIHNFNLESEHSNIRNTDLNIELSEADSLASSSFNIKLNLDKSDISFIELGELIPALDGMDQNIEVSGEIRGNLDDLKGKNITLSTGRTTKTVLDFYINDLSDIENMYLFFDLKESATTFSDLSSIRLPKKSKIRFLNFPETFYEAGILRFKGNFSGFLSDFVTFGTLQSEMGTLSTDILVTPERADTVYYRGNISTSNFDLGRLFQKEILGKLTFSGSVDGKYMGKTESVSGIFKGDINEIGVNNYSYKDIQFDGILYDKMFDGLLAMNDPNLRFSFLGQVDLNSEIPDFDFRLNLDKALLGNLNFSKSFPDSEVAFKMQANFTGDNIDNLDGSIDVTEGFYKNRNGEVELSGMEIQTGKNDAGNILNFTSDFVDVEINGQYYFRTIGNELKKVFSHFIPASQLAIEEQALRKNNFEFKALVKDLDTPAKIFVPGLQLDTPFTLYGKMDSSSDDVQLHGNIPGLKYNNVWARDISILNKTINDSYTSKLRFNEVMLKNGMKLYNFSSDTKVADNIADNTISWSNYDELTYSGSIKTRTTISQPDSSEHPHIEIEGSPTRIFIADTVWNIEPFFATIDSSAIAINNFNINNKQQMLAANGRIDKNSSDLLNIDIKNINLSYLNKYLNKDFDISGIANGKIGLANLSEKPVILSDLSVDKLHYKKQFMGDISMVSNWNSNNSAIDSELKITREDRLSLNAFGSYKPSTHEVDFDITVDSVALFVLETFIRKNFSHFKGYGSGKVNIGGTTDKLLFNGALKGNNAGLTIDVTQIPYSFNDSVYFKNDTILFDNITVYDTDNNTGKFNGTLVHQNFHDMIYNLWLTSDKINALNTTSRDNEQFYGIAVGRGRLDITGRAKTVNLNGSVTSLPGTEIKISMEDENEVEQYDFLEFVTNDEPEENDFFAPKKKEENDLNLSLTIEATPEAKVQLIYNSQIGDIIKAQGEGIMLFEMNPEGEIFLSGNYNVTKGDYLFTLQNVINKRFTIEKGGSIVWSGDPYNADIDIRAIYKLKASLYDLLSNYENESLSQRITVECIIVLEDELMNPTIGFDINFPTAEAIIKDRLQQFFNTEDELNKQILSLIVMGKFYTPEYLQGTYEAQSTNMLGTTASELLSNQLSNWLSQINEDWDVGINYRPGNLVTDDEIELALSTQIFNDRVTLNGNIGNNANQYSTNSSQIVGDFEMNVKLVPSGKIEFIAYSRSNNNLIYETAPYTQGIGLSFKEEYNSIDELFKKFVNIFKKKRK